LRRKTFPNDQYPARLRARRQTKNRQQSRRLEGPRSHRRIGPGHARGGRTDASPFLKVRVETIELPDGRRISDYYQLMPARYVSVVPFSALSDVHDLMSKDSQPAGARRPFIRATIVAECRTKSVNLVDTIWDQKQLSSLKDMTGQRFGRLTVVRRTGMSAGGIATWLCRCDCGNRSIVVGSGLRRGRTKSCGCYGRRTGTMNTTHGHSKHYRKSPEYSAWSSLLA
jgi:hypothetical protein